MAHNDHGPSDRRLCRANLAFPAPKWVCLTHPHRDKEKPPDETPFPPPAASRSASPHRIGCVDYSLNTSSGTVRVILGPRAADRWRLARKLLPSQNPRAFRRQHPGWSGRSFRRLKTGWHFGEDTRPPGGSFPRVGAWGGSGWRAAGAWRCAPIRAIGAGVARGAWRWRSAGVTPILTIASAYDRPEARRTLPQPWRLWAVALPWGRSDAIGRASTAGAVGLWAGLWRI